MKINAWQVLLFVSLILGASWLVFPGPRDMVSIYFQDNKREKAQAMLEKLLAASPEDPDLNQSMAELLYNNGEAEKAIGYLEKVLKLRPERVDQLLRLSDWRESVGRSDEAVQALEAALARLPAASERQPETLANRRSVLLRLLDFYVYQDKREGQLAAVKQLLPLDRSVHAKLLAGSAPLRQVNAELERLAALPAPQSEDPVLQTLLVDCYVLRKLLFEDISDGQGGPAREKTFVTDIIELYVRGGLVAEATQLAQALDGQAGSASARMVVAQALAGYGAGKAAVQLMDQLLAERPGDTAMLGFMAEQMQDAGNPQDAVRYLERLVQAAPADVPAKRRLGRALLEAGRPEEAFACLAPLPLDRADGPDAALSLLEAAEATARVENVAQAAQAVAAQAGRDDEAAVAVGLRLADAWLGVNRPDEAWPLLQRLAARNTDDRALVRKAFGAASGTNNPAHMREALALLLRQDPLEPDMILEAASALENQNELGAAAKLYERYLALVPGDRKTALHLTEVHSWRGAPDMALALTERLLKAQPGDTALMKRAAAYAEEAGKDKDAFRLYAALFRANPKDKALRASYLRLAEWTGNTADAAKLLAEESDREPQNAHKARQTAEAYLAANETKKALPYLERALSLKADDADLRRSLADAYGALGQTDRQVAALEPLAARNLLSEEELAFVAGRHLERKQPQKALALLQRYEHISPLPWNTGGLLVQAYTQLNKPEAALSLMRRLKDDYRAQPARLADIGDMAVMHKRIDFAGECYTAALKADPKNGPALKGMAQIYAWNNDAARAIKGFETYTARRPGDIDARYQLGELYFGSDRQEDAFGEYKKTLKLIRETRKAREAKPAAGGATP